MSKAAVPLWEEIGIMETHAPETLKILMLPFRADAGRDHEKSIALMPADRDFARKTASLADTIILVESTRTVVGNENGALLFTVVSA